MSKPIPKAKFDDMVGRFREIVSDPNNARIPRIPEAGLLGRDQRFEDPFVIMHNGLRVLVGQNGYYGPFSQILCINRGVHEPQEEYAFMRVLEHVDPTLPMVELGAYWGFYSLWYKHHCPDADVYLVEPEQANLELGKKNFELNGKAGKFLRHFIGENGLKFDDFLSQNKIEKLGVLHADIQGAEQHLIPDIKNALREKKVEFLVISTHSQELHQLCISEFEACGYRVVADADYDHASFSYDGIVIACLPEKGLEPFELFSRAEHSLEKNCQII